MTYSSYWWCPRRFKRNVPVVFITEEPCLNLKEIVSYEVRTVMWFWLRAELKGINGAKLFKYCASQNIQVPLGRTYGFPFPWKGKDTHSSLKTDCTSVLVGKAHMNPSGTPAVTRLQTFTNWCFLSITMVCTLNWFCASHSRSFGSYHIIFEEPGKCQLQVGLGNRSCQWNKLAQ